MGYRSNVVLTYVFKHKFVQAHALAKEWQVYDWNGMWGLTYTAEHVKWYDSYEVVHIKGREM